MPRSRLFRFLSPLALLLATAVPAGPTLAQIAVFDPTNYAQNLLTASRALQQVNNEIQSLQNEATMLQNMAKNLKTFNVSSLSKINSDLAQINSLIAQAKGISTSITQTQAVFQAQFPGTYSAAVSTNTLVSGAQARWQSTIGSYQQTLLVQAQIDQALQSDAATVNSVLSASEGTQGTLGAQQAANQLLALSTKQQMQVEALMAAQYRAEAVDAARKVEAEAAGQAATAQFLGSATAYTPN